MGWSSERHIEMHNHALASDADYRAEYESSMADLDAHLEEIRTDVTTIDWFPEYKLSHTGYEEFEICPLCYKPSDNMIGIHYQCELNERAWSEINDGF